MEAMAVATLLNISSQRVKIKRSFPYSTSIHMDAYVKRCSFQTDIKWCGEEFSQTGERSLQYDIGDITRVITSDDIFKFLLIVRVKREQIQVKANMLIKRNTVLKYDVESSLKVPCHLDFETGKQFVSGNAIQCITTHSLYARYNNSQIILATLSPFLLGIEGAKIYNFDEHPVKVSKFEELEAVRFYHDFLCERLNKKK